MITYLVGTGYGWGMTGFITDWAPSLASRLRVLEYPEVFSLQRLDSGTYIFVDIDVVPARQRAAAVELWTQLQRAGDRVRLLNDPSLMLRRFELLEALNAAGINRFRAYRVEDRRAIERYPVFLKREDAHSGSLSRLLESPAEVDRAIVRAVIRGVPAERIIIVEFCDTADANGLYRKYGAFSVAGRILPRHMFATTNWTVREATRNTPLGLLEEERRYVAGNPHEEQIARVFEIANIDYGRIDYSLLGDSIQVWEININPTYLLRAKDDPAREPLAVQVAAGLAEALAGLDSVQPGEPIPISIPGTTVTVKSLRRRPRSFPAALRRAYVAVEPMMSPVRKVFLSRTDRRLRALR